MIRNDKNPRIVILHLNGTKFEIYKGYTPVINVLITKLQIS